MKIFWIIVWTRKEIAFIKEGNELILINDEIILEMLFFLSTAIFE